MMEAKFRNKYFPWGGFLLIALAVVLAVEKRDTLSDFPKGDSWYFAAVYLVLAVAGWRAAIRPVVVADANGLLVRNPLRTYRLTWPEIKGFRGEDRLVVELHGGREVHCWAVEAANITRMLGRRSSVDDIADELEKIRVRHLGAPPPP